MSVQAFAWVMENSEARLAARLTLMSIANHCDSLGENSFPSVGLIAKEAKISDREVQRSLRILVELGELAIAQGAGPRGVHMYSLPLMRRGDNLSPVKLSGVTNPTKRGDKSGGAIRNNRHEPKIKSTNTPQPPLKGGLQFLTPRQLHNLSKELDRIYTVGLGVSGGQDFDEQALQKACIRLCLPLETARAAIAESMGKKYNFSYGESA